MEFIDTHCHIYDEAFKGEEDAYIARAEEAGVRIMLQPDVDSRERDAMFSLTDRHPGVLRPMLGLYPGSVDKDWRMEIDRMLEYSDRKVVAIGEIGLDYYYGKEFASEQREALHWQLDYARERDLPVNIHLREGEMQTFLRESLVNQFVHLEQHIKIVFGFHSHPNGDINGTFTHLDKLNNGLRGFQNTRIGITKALQNVATALL